MSYDFNADEVFDMAEQLERNGAKFYRNAAEGDVEQSNKQMLLDLAAMEDEHEKTFKLLRADLAENEKQTTVFDPQGEAALYLRALADTRVFFEKDIDISSMREILKSAIGMKDAVTENLGKGRIDGIIKEEMGHIKMLSKELLKYKS
jgi:rubrerythrin